MAAAPGSRTIAAHARPDFAAVRAYPAVRAREKLGAAEFACLRAYGKKYILAATEHTGALIPVSSLPPVQFYLWRCRDSLAAASACRHSRHCLSFELSLLCRAGAGARTAFARKRGRQLFGRPSCRG